MVPRRLVVVAALFSVASVGLSLTQLASPALARDVAAGDFFEYDYVIAVDQGSGSYEGYTETTRTRARYDVTNASGDLVSMRGVGAWTYVSSDGTFQSGSFDRPFVFLLTSRRYINATDLDRPYADPRVWFWIPPGLPEGSRIQILDDNFTLSRVHDTIWINAVPRTATFLETFGSYLRDDVYGTYSVNYHDRYYFDAATGFIVAEVYEETDVGFYQGLPASFRWREEVFVTSSSYPVPVDPVQAGAVYAGIPVLVAATAYVGVRRYRGPTSVRSTTPLPDHRVRIRRVRGSLDAYQPATGSVFDPLLPTFVRRADKTDRIVAATAGSRLEGLLVYDRESGDASVFGSDASVRRGMARIARAKRVFSEDPVPGISRGPPVTTFLVLELRTPTPSPFDPELVRPMERRDLEAVSRLAEAAYRGKTDRWIGNCFDGGDLGFVAEVERKIIGFGFATLADSVARLHTLTVAAAYRGEGIGSEIMAARLSALSAMGVQRVLVEIAETNAASLRISRKAGFAEVARTRYWARSGRVEALPEER